MNTSKTHIPGIGRGWTFQLTSWLWPRLGFRRPSTKVFRATNGQINETVEFDPYFIQLSIWACHNGLQVGWRFARKMQRHNFTFIWWPWKRKAREVMEATNRRESAAQRKQGIDHLRKIGASDGVIEHLWGKS